MATLHKEIVIDAPARDVWDAVRDVGARVVSFANGLLVRELIVSVDDERRRFAYAAVGGLASHHNASMQVFEAGAQRSRLVWITDVLPDALVGPIGALIEQGAAAMQRALGHSG